jgi:hypothetical protein
MAWGGKSKLAAGASPQLPTPNRRLVLQEFVTVSREKFERNLILPYHHRWPCVETKSIANTDSIAVIYDCNCLST